MELPGKVETLLGWCSERGIVIDSRLTVQPDGNGGIGVFTGKAGIDPGETVVTIPKTAVLSARSCSLSPAITPAFSGSEAQLALSAALYTELLPGPESRWYGYLQSLPDTIDLPICWEAWMNGKTHPPEWFASDCEDIRDALNWLRGTEVERNLTGRGHGVTFPELHKYFQGVVKPLLKERASHDSDLNGFLRAYCLVSSRAFLVDSYHGLAMVPIADAFNHAQENHVHLESEYQVCSECGSLDECPHDRNDGEDMMDTGHTLLSSEGYEMVVNAPVPPFSEVYNTYGESLSNAELLCQHGFVLDANEHDSLTWTSDEVFNAVPGLSLSLREEINHTCTHLFADTEFMASFEETRCLLGGVVGESRSPYTINADGLVSVQLWILLLLASAHQTSQAPAALLDKEESRSALQSLYGLQVALENQVECLDDSGDGTKNYGNIGALLGCMDGRYVAVLKHSCELLVALCQTRKANTGQRGHGDEEEDLLAQLDALGPEKRRTRFALLLVINEKLILNSCEAAWKDLLTALEHAPHLE